jgi:hypothetical protein
VVKGRRYSVYTEMDSDSTSIVISFDASINHRDKLDSGAQLPNTSESNRSVVARCAI